MAIGTAAAIIGGAAIAGGATAYSSSRAAKASREAAKTQASAEAQSLEYLKEREAIPQQFRETAIQQLGALYGLPGIEVPEGAEPGFQPAAREEFIAGLREDPFYREQLRAGEEAILRGASATGGLRSGGTSAALAKLSPALLQQTYQERVGGLAGLAELPSYAPQIATGISGIGATRAAGQMGVAQARQAGIQGITDIGLGALGAGLQYGVI